MAKIELDKKTVDEVRTIFEILSELRDIVVSDRALAVENYEYLLDKSKEDELASDTGALEREINNALGLVIKASDKIPKVMDVIAKMGVARYKGDVLLKVAGHQENEIDLNDPDDKLRLIRERRTLGQHMKMLSDKND